VSAMATITLTTSDYPASFAPWPAKTKPDNCPLRHESDHEKVKNDNHAESYRRDLDSHHSEENTPIVRQKPGSAWELGKLSDHQ